MKTVESTALAAGAAIAITHAHAAAAATSPAELIAGIKSTDAAIRGSAWQGAASHGAPAVQPLAALMTDDDFEIARSARRALWLIVRHAGRPKALKEAAAVAKELIAVLANQPATVRREALWMLSEIGGDDAISPMAALLSDADLREDARCALTRLPGRKATAALRSAFPGASEDFKYALAESLRRRGETVKGYATRKLTPTRQTTVIHGQTG